jgi:hypothetical protein
MIKKIQFICSLLTGIVLIAACERINLKDYEVAKDVDMTKNTMVRFIHAFSSNSINTVTPVTATTPPPAFNFFVNGQRLNGFTTASSSPSNLTFYFGAFPGVNTTGPTTNGANGSLNTGSAPTSTILPDYSVFPGGNLRVAAVLNRFTGASPADTVIAQNLQLDNGKKYSVIAADTIPFQRFYLFEDNWSNTYQKGTYQIRIINLAPNITTSSFDVYSRRKFQNLAINVNYRSATQYAVYTTGGTFGITNDTLEVRAAGSAATLVQFNGFFPVEGRAYTFVIRGMSNLATANPRYLAISGYINR